MEPVAEKEMLGMIKTLSETEYIKRIRSHFVVRDVDIPHARYIRVGRPLDGGYIMLDDFDRVTVAYSAGISNEISWDKAMTSISAEHRGGEKIDVFMYDHTINALPEENPNFHWSKTGLTGVFEPNHPELETLPRLIQKNGHGYDYDMILKMDIEGAEYNVLQAIDTDTLNHFSQIVMEIHFLLNPKYENLIGFCLDKLNATHQLVHIHANNHGSYLVRGGLVLPDVVEATYLRRADYNFIKSQRFFPTAIDRPCNPISPEINLGYWG